MCDCSQVILALLVGLGLASCELPVSSQYGVPGNYNGNGGGNIGGDGTVTNSYGTPLTGGHDAHQDYIDSQVCTMEFKYAIDNSLSISLRRKTR